jgi:ubiquinone/menaquinone biosynthesis C-methylase UbiE
METPKLDQEYSQSFTDLLEFIYGPSFLSQGGTECLDLLFEGQSLDGKSLLDIGSGLGGVDFYLAEKHRVRITGVDRVSRMVEVAEKRKLERNLLGQANFVHQKSDADFTQFPGETFDFVFSKESLLHVADKLALLRAVYQLLKPQGKLMVLDWTTNTKKLGPLIQEMIAVDQLDLKLATQEEYREALIKTGFENILITSLNDKFIRYTQSNIETVKANRIEICRTYGVSVYEYSVKSWELQKKIFERGEVIVSFIQAVKV